ncbi:MAG: hypothetical protein KDI64_15275, partial [Candidatus Accumulibacter sp.]|nr:hypothetical protein [Accumulibacter sp.]
EKMEAMVERRAQFLPAHHGRSLGAGFCQQPPGVTRMSESLDDCTERPQREAPAALSGRMTGAERQRSSACDFQEEEWPVISGAGGCHFRLEADIVTSLPTRAGAAGIESERHPTNREDHGSHR